MTDLQTLILRALEIKDRLAVIADMADMPDETRAEFESLKREYQANGVRQQALILTEDQTPPPIESRADPQGREIRSILRRANLGTMIGNVIEQRSQEGAEKELADHYGLSHRQIPMTMLREWQELETRAATPAPTNVGTMQQETLTYVFPQSVGAFLGVDMAQVANGETVYPVLSTSPTVAAPAEGVTVPETDGVFTSDVLTPGRLQAAYIMSREDMARFANMQTDLRESLSMGIMDGLDAQLVAGVNGFLGTGGLTARAGDAGAEAVFSDYRALLFDSATIDGRYAGASADIRLVMGPATYAHGGTVYRTANSDISALENLMTNSGGVRASAHVPAPSTNDQDVIVRKGMRRAMVQPQWIGLDIVYDEVTRASQGEVVITAVALFAQKIIRADDFVRRVIQVA